MKTPDACLKPKMSNTCRQKSVEVRGGGGGVEALTEQSLRLDNATSFVT